MKRPHGMNDKTDETVLGDVVRCPSREATFKP